MLKILYHLLYFLAPFLVYFLWVILSNSNFESIDLSKDTTLNLKIGFNSRYLLDIAKQISGANIIFLLSDKLSPTLIFDDDEKQALYLLMPMHI